MVCAVCIVLKVWLSFTLTAIPRALMKKRLISHEITPLSKEMK